ncbi:unnamed protein product [Prorocentrum cordatum]|uniref:Isochorismatase-like domain-containing protein n=1 Tax=Prorocentrum cordatum TaxID=2364126 RepID=A0ABN9QYB4_9DINO|nr:unnamed protein product [Polarella glacialis]
MCIRRSARAPGLAGSGSARAPRPRAPCRRRGGPWRRPWAAARPGAASCRPKMMERTTKTVMASPARRRFGFGRRAAVVNVDIQKAYTSGEFPTSYMSDPHQMEFVNKLSALARSKGMPVIWTHVAYMEDGSDAGVWGTRTNTPDSLQNIKFGSRRSEFDDRLEIDKVRDAIYLKKMPSCFHETPLQSLLVFHGVDTVVLTGGSTSGCIRASAVDSLSRGYRTIVPIECVADNTRATTTPTSRTWR